MKEITEENYNKVLNELENNAKKEENLASTKASTLLAEEKNLQGWQENYEALSKSIHLGLEPDTNETREALENAYHGLTLALDILGYSYPEDNKLKKQLLFDFIPLDLQIIQTKLSKIRGETPVKKVYSEPNTPTLYEVLDDFLENRAANKDIRQDTLNEYRTSVRDFVFIFGDKSVEDITYEDATKFRGILQKIPKHRNKDKDLIDLNAKELLALNKAEEECLSGATVSGRITNLRTIFEWLESRKITSSNPFKTVRLSFSNNSHPDFTIEELKIIFNSELYQEDSPYFRRKTTTASYWWLPLVSLFSGARPSELIQMKIDHVEKINGVLCGKVWDDEESNTRKKTPAALRVFPIHPKLIELGFEEYVKSLESNSADRIFEGIKVANRKPGDYAGKWFNDRYRKKYLPEQFLNKRKVLYSFRHTYITTALNYANMNTSAMEVMVGHKDPENISQNTYNHKLDSHHINQLIPKYFKEQSKLEYVGLDLAHLIGQWKKLELM